LTRRELVLLLHQHHKY